MRLKKIGIAGMLLAAGVLLGGQASAGEAEIRGSMAKLYPTAKIREINPTRVPGIFEVVVDQEVFYSDAEGKFFFLQAQMIDVEKGNNVTEDRKQRLSAIKFEDLPLTLATKIVKGNGSRVFASFEDANCGYCKRLHAGMSKLTDYTQYVFMVPMLGPDSKVKADALWCAKDKAKALSEWMTNNVPPADEKCKTPTQEVADLARKLGVSGTPTMFLADGSRLPGYLPPERMEQALAKVAAAKVGEKRQ